MQGLRGQEGKRFERYWALVQAAAHAEGCVFFLECGAGRPFEDGGLAGEDLRGWLIPEGDADVFEMEWRGGPVGGGWDDDYNHFYKTKFFDYEDPPAQKWSRA